jgi:hypothetical protein
MKTMHGKGIGKALVGRDVCFDAGRACDLSWSLYEYAILYVQIINFNIRLRAE